MSNIAVSHIDRLVVDVDLGPKSTKTIDGTPMRGGPSAVEYPCCGKEECTAAYGCDARSAQEGLLHEPADPTAFESAVDSYVASSGDDGVRFAKSSSREISNAPIRHDANAG